MKHYYIHVHLADEQRCYWAAETPKLLDDIIYAEAVPSDQLTTVALALYRTWGMERITKMVAIDCSDDYWITDKIRQLLNL